MFQVVTEDELIHVHFRHPVFYALSHYLFSETVGTMEYNTDGAGRERTDGI